MTLGAGFAEENSPWASLCSPGEMLMRSFLPPPGEDKMRLAVALEGTGSRGFLLRVCLNSVETFLKYEQT